MANHFACVGFSMDMEKAISDVITNCIAQGKAFSTGAGNRWLIAWSPVSGAEIWTQHIVDPENKQVRLVDCAPHFSGYGRVRVGITGVTTSDVRPSEGMLTGWADPDDENDPESGRYPFHFDVPDYDLIRDELRIPCVAVFQIAAFAEGTMKCFLSEDQYDELVVPIGCNPDMEPVFVGPESFFPGSTREEDDGNTVPNPRAFFTGKIESVETLHNDIGGGDFYHLLVRTYGGSFDVVACPEIVDAVPVVGGVVQGNFWLSGRIARSS